MAEPIPQMRSFDDTTATRGLIYKNALESVQKRFPVEDDEYRIELRNPRYTGPQDFSMEEQKQALMKERNLHTPITGTWRLIHKPTNRVLDEREDVVLNVPYYTDRGTMIRAGNEYASASQSRLRPGVYVRKQRTGEVEAHVNIKPGAGKPFRVHLEPETGVFKLNVGQSNIPLYPLMKAMGISDKQMTEQWGAELATANIRNNDVRSLPKIYGKMAGYKADPTLNAEGQARYLREELPKFEMDHEVNARTLGLEGAHGVTPEVLLRTTKKMLNVSRGDERADDRDSPQFSTIHSVEDLIAERIDKDAGKLTQTLLRKAKRSRNLQGVYRGALNPYIDSFVLGSGLVSPLEETNPLSTLEQMNRVTKLGEGGIGSAEAITEEARDVNPGQLGLIDPITGPECFTASSEVMSRKGWVRWDQVDQETEFACWIDGELQYRKAEKLHVSDWDGLLYGASTKFVQYLVTPNHRLWVRPYDDQPLAYRFESALQVHEKQSNRIVRTGGHSPYVGTDLSYFHLPEVTGGNGLRNLSEGLPIEAWAAFMGWYLSEGSCAKLESKKTRVALSQTDSKYVEVLRGVLDLLPFPYCEDRDHGVLKGFIIHRKQLCAYLQQFGYAKDKFIPEYLLEAPVAARRALFDALCFGDGRRKGDTFTYCSCSRQMALDVERLAFSLGHATRVRFEKDEREQSNTGGMWCVHICICNERLIRRATKTHPTHFFTQNYTGKVYCATVPGGLMYCRTGDYGGHWTGNSEAAGIDVRASYGARKGRDGHIYGEYRDPHSGKTHFLKASKVADSTIAFPGQMARNTPMVYAMKQGQVQQVPRSEIQYEVPSFGHMFSSHTNLNPMPTAVQAGRQFYGAKFWSQYMPQVSGEVPLVDSLMADGKTTYSEYYGRKIGTVAAKAGGTVTKVTPDSVTVTDEQGKKHVEPLVKNYPFNRLTGLSYFPAVEEGQKVKAGDMIAHSNFTDKKTGALNLGQNLKVAIIPYKGHSYEDAAVISESAAKKMATERLFGYDLEARHGTEMGRSKFISLFPRLYSQQQIENLDEQGIAKPGTVLHKGDPIMLAVGPKLLTSQDAQLGKLHKVLRNAFTDKSQTWDYAWPGTVTDIAQIRRGARVNIKSTPPVAEADKLSTRFGLKGVVGKVVPDDQMPRDAVTNKPYDMLLNPMTILSRTAPNQIMEMTLGKIAKATGKQIRIPQESPPEGWDAWVKKQMDQAGVQESSDVFDPETGKTIKGIGDGHIFVSAFHHIAEKKLSARSESGSYDVNEQPSRGGSAGSKKYSMMDQMQTLAHGATDVVKDVVQIRGTKNEDYWKALKLGKPIPEPGVPFIYNKFLNTLKAGGINLSQEGDTTKLLPMMDQDVTALSKGAIQKSEMVDSNFEPMPGGLFDVGKTGGMGGNKWTHIDLPEPIPNPVMEEPVRRILGLRVKDMEDILSGRQKLNGLTGGPALKAALEKVNIDDMIESNKQKVRTLRGSNRDNAVKILGYLSSAKEQGIHPSAWMIQKVPVLPPVFRPVSRMGDVGLISDINELYRDVIESSKSFQTLKPDLPEEELADERLNVYRAVKAAYGLGDPITPEGQSKRLKGAVRQVIGDSPKFGMWQSKVLSKPVDAVGRGVITPDPNLNMDQMGIPEDSAWTLYKDFTMRRLVQHGYPAIRATEMIDKRTPEARDALDKEMEHRVIIADRAPTWHKFNIMAFHPHIVEGHTIRMCPLVTKGFNADFDGDQMNFHVPASQKANDQAKEKMLPSANLFSLTDLHSVRHSPTMEMTAGLYALTKPATKKPVQRFRTRKEAEDAYHHGTIGANDPIEILGQ